MKKLLVEKCEAYVYGGFNEVHNQCDLYDISLLNHEESECILCKMKKKAKEAAKKKNKSIFGVIKHFFDGKSKNDSRKIKIKYDEITKMTQNTKNFVTVCIYKDKSSESIEERNKQLILCLLHEVKEIQLYHQEKNKFYITKPQITNKKNKAIIVNQTEYKKELELCLIEKISIFDIKSVKKKPKMRNIVTIEYIKPPQEENEQIREYSLVLDLMSENESKKFIDKIGRAHV